MPPAPMMPTRIGSPAGAEPLLCCGQRGWGQRRCQRHGRGRQELAAFQRESLLEVGLVAHGFPHESRLPER